MSGIFGAMGLGGLGRPAFDSAAADAAKAVQAKISPIDLRAAMAQMQNLRGLALSCVFLLVDAVTEDSLPEDMLPSEFLDGLLHSGLQGGSDDEVDPLLMQLLNAHVADALSSLGVEDDLILDMNSDDVEAADAAIEAAAPVVLANKPDDGDDLDGFTHAFMYGFDEKDVMDEGKDGRAFDSAHLSAGAHSTKTVNGHKVAYTAVKVVRDGHVKVVNQRQKGQHVVQTAKQKAAMHALHSKPHSHSSLIKMHKSLMVGNKHDLYKNGGALIKGSNTRQANHIIKNTHIF